MARAERVVCLMAYLPRGASGWSAHPADVRLELAGADRLVVGLDDHVAARDVDLVGEAQGHADMVGNAASTSPSKVSIAGHRGALAAGEDDDLGAGPQHAAGHLARVAAVVVVGVAHRADHPLHREAHVVEVAVLGDDDVLEVVEQRRGAVPLHASERSTTLSPCSAEIGMKVMSGIWSRADQSVTSSRIS